MSIWDLREVRRQLEKEGHSTVNEQLIFDTYNRLRRQEQQSIGKTKSARRKMQRALNTRRLSNRELPKSIQPVARVALDEPAQKQSGLSTKWKS